MGDLIDFGALKMLEKKVDLLMEAISMCHESNVEGTCGPKCLACRVREIMESLQVAERIGGADG